MEVLVLRGSFTLTLAIVNFWNEKQSRMSIETCKIGPKINQFNYEIRETDFELYCTVKCKRYTRQTARGLCGVKKNRPSRVSVKQYGLPSVKKNEIFRINQCGLSSVKRTSSSASVSIKTTMR